MTLYSGGGLLPVFARGALVDGAVAVGTAVGLPCALAAGRLIRSLLYGLGPNDPATIVAVSAIFAVVAIGACWIPAYRASSIDPMAALRQE